MMIRLLFASVLGLVLTVTPLTLAAPTNTTLPADSLPDSIAARQPALDQPTPSLTPRGGCLSRACLESPSQSDSQSQQESQPQPQPQPQPPQPLPPLIETPISWDPDSPVRQAIWVDGPMKAITQSGPPRGSTSRETYQAFESVSQASFEGTPGRRMWRFQEVEMMVGSSYHVMFTYPTASAPTAFKFVVNFPELSQEKHNNVWAYPNPPYPGAEVSTASISFKAEASGWFGVSAVPGPSVPVDGVRMTVFRDASVGSRVGVRSVAARQPALNHSAPSLTARGGCLSLECLGLPSSSDSQQRARKSQPTREPLPNAQPQRQAPARVQIRVPWDANSPGWRWVWQHEPLYVLTRPDMPRSLTARETYKAFEGISESLHEGVPGRRILRFPQVEMIMGSSYRVEFTYPPANAPTIFKFLANVPGWYRQKSPILEVSPSPADPHARTSTASVWFTAEASGSFDVFVPTASVPPNGIFMTVFGEASAARQPALDQPAPSLTPRGGCFSRACLESPPQPEPPLQPQLEPEPQLPPTNLVTVHWDPNSPAYYWASATSPTRWIPRPDPSDDLMSWETYRAFRSQFQASSEGPIGRQVLRFRELEMRQGDSYRIMFTFTAEAAPSAFKFMVNDPAAQGQTRPIIELYPRPGMLTASLSFEVTADETFEVLALTAGAVPRGPVSMTVFRQQVRVES